ncbi:unnamed protein product [Rotaria sp. Silwood1]|nr:unnamed protein product [Rotaria sp. Silwood1]
MADKSDFDHNFEQTLNEIFADLNNFDFLQTFSVDTTIKFHVPTQNARLATLKIKVDDFFQQYPAIVNDIKNYFYEDLIMYTMKRMFDPSFTVNNVKRASELFNDFFIKHEENIKIKFNYIF